MKVEEMEELIVPAGKYYVVSNPIRLACIGLGSCLAITMHDPRKGLGGLAHTMLPTYSDGHDKENPGKYTDMAIYLMIDELIELGGHKSGLKAKIVGGAQMFQNPNTDFLDIGKRNIDSAIRTLENEGICLVSKHVGGSKGRNVWFDVCTGMIDLQMGRNAMISI